ncbi:Proteasome assembly chaperone 2 [Phytophthora boehmeriae]|uniref:Proteasome assembly chaperone 2 n=1 Tax=Phytophthora boehmeriae TaxID=109152 RepID=A0A8T1X2G3_9STRA|nr:Proteasome assembly chaperone 2 [Phytophthora boehmeriae]
MEFYPQDAADAADAAACSSLFAGHTVLLPAVSNANLGQLTLDLLINSLLQNGEAFQTKLTRVGHLLSEAAPPIAGGAAFATQQPSGLCLNLEVYRSAEKKLTIIQQRAPALPGRIHAFTRDLVEWAANSKVAVLGVVAGCDDMLRHDPNMMSRPIRTIYSADATQLDGVFHDRFTGLATAAREQSEAAVTASSSGDQWKPIRGAGLAPLLHEQCDEYKLPFIAWVMPCAEGNNVPDAAAMTTQLLKSLHLVPTTPYPSKPDTPSPTAPIIPFAFPPSWSQLFGRGPDVSLYL